jgi:hypothetical protein
MMTDRYFALTCGSSGAPSFHSRPAIIRSRRITFTVTLLAVRPMSGPDLATSARSPSQPDEPSYLRPRYSAIRFGKAYKYSRKKSKKLTMSAAS